jgi:mannose-1-phosphate guanylyltransferase
MIDTAIILAGGMGTRLRPLTNETPKPLLPISGKPIIQHTIELLKYYGIKNIILSLGYKSDLIKDYFKNGEELGINISYSIENEPLGTGGAVKKAAKNLKESFFLLWGDNLTDIDYSLMYTEYLKNNNKILMTLTPREDVEHFGVAKLNQNVIMNFIEKPKRKHAPSNLINAGAFIIHPKYLETLPKGKSSMEKDCFERLAPLGEITAYIHNGQWHPTDTLEKYNLAETNFTNKF